MATYNAKSISFGGNTYNLYPSNLASETQLTNQAQDATEVANRVYPVRMDANGKLAVNVPWTDSGGSSAAKIIHVTGTITNTSGAYEGTFSDSRVTGSMTPLTLELGTPEIFGGEIQVETDTGEITISCDSVVGSSTFKIGLINSAETTVTSEEYDELDSKISSLNSNLHNIAEYDATVTWLKNNNVVRVVNEDGSAYRPIEASEVTAKTSGGDITLSGLNSKIGRYYTLSGTFVKDANTSVVNIGINKTIKRLEAVLQGDGIALANGAFLSVHYYPSVGAISVIQTYSSADIVGTARVYVEYE